MSERSFAVVGLGFGDEGKGTITEYLVRRYNIPMVARYSGGSQAAHSVVEPSGRHHTFAQFGSATLQSGVKTYLSPFMLVDPANLLAEDSVLREKGVNDGLSRLYVDSQCLVITPFQKLVNRMREISRGENRRGSCGKGISETAQDSITFRKMALRIGDLRDEKTLKKKLYFLWRQKLSIAEDLLAKNSENQRMVEIFNNLNDREYVSRLMEVYNGFTKTARIIESGQSMLKNGVVFEGAQGVLIDVNFGFIPYVTGTDVTVRNALELTQGQDVTKVGVLRAYGTRHGFGPFVTEDVVLSAVACDQNNVFNEWQSDFRIGWFDAVAAKYAIACNDGVDALALTNIDGLNGLTGIKVCVAYDYRGSLTGELDKYFVWKPSNNGRVKIMGIKTSYSKDNASRERLTEMLGDCVPEYVTLDGWDKASSESSAVRTFVDFIRSTLSMPISILSFGPTWQDKVEVGY